MWKHSQSQQNMQTINETPTQAFSRVRNELFSLLQAAAGEESLHTAIGHWRQRVNNLIAEAFELTQSAAVAATKPFGQAQMDGLGAGQLVANNTDIHFDQAGIGSIPYNPATGVFTLEANKTYELSASFQAGTFSGETVNIGIEWVDSVTNAVLHANRGAILTPVDNTNSLSIQPLAQTIHQTTAAQGVKCRVTGTIGSATILGGFTFATVKEI